MKPLSIPDGDALWAQVKRFWTRETKIAFFAALACALLTHLYILTNDLPNHDGFYYRFSRNDILSSGRWSLFALSKLSGRFSAPTVNGVIAILALSAFTALAVRMLEIKRTIWILVASALIVTCPTISNTFAYMFTVDAYFLALLLTVLGVYWTDRKRFGWIGGGVLLGLSLGAYQAYIFTGLSLLGIRYLQLLLSPEPDDREMGKTFLRYALAVILAVAVYFAGLRLMLDYRQTSLGDYKGAADLLGGGSTLTFSAAWEALRRIYVVFLNPVQWQAGGMLQSEFAWAVYTGALVLNLGLTVFLTVKTGKKSAFRYGMLALVTLASPLLFNGIFFLDGTQVYPVMTFALVFVFVESVVLLERACALPCVKQRGMLRQGTLTLGYVLAAALILLSLNWFRYSNHAYAGMQLQFDSHYAIANRIVDRIEQTEGFSYDTPVYFAGKLENGNYSAACKDEEFSYYVNTVAFSYGGDYTYFFNDAYIKKFMANYVGVYFADAESAAVEAAAQTEAYKNMPSFPETGSTAIINGVLMVKLGRTA